MNIYCDIESVEVFYTFKCCTAGKVWSDSYIVRDVRRLLLDGIMSILYKETKRKFIKIITIIAHSK